MSRDSVNKAINAIFAGNATDSDVFQALWSACLFNWKEEVVAIIKTPQGSQQAASKHNACLRKAVSENHYDVATVLLENPAVLAGVVADPKPLLIASISMNQPMLDLFLSKPVIAAHPDTKAILALDV